jgi:hypothetical protein
MILDAPFGLANGAGAGACDARANLDCFIHMVLANAGCFLFFGHFPLKLKNIISQEPILSNFNLKIKAFHLYTRIVHF